jgi:hypothetical protein
MNERGQYGHHAGRATIGWALPFSLPATTPTPTPTKPQSKPITPSPSPSPDAIAIDKAKRSALGHLEGYRFGSRINPKPGAHRYFGEGMLKTATIPFQKEADSLPEMEEWLLGNSGYDLVWAGYFDARTGALIREATAGKLSAAPYIPPAPLPSPTPNLPPLSSPSSSTAPGTSWFDPTAPGTPESSSKLRNAVIIGVAATALVGIAIGMSR